MATISNIADNALHNHNDLPPNSAAAIHVTKRDGRIEHFDAEKIHRVISWAAQDLNQVSVSDVELKAHIQFYAGINTSTIHDMLIQSAANLITEQTPDYQYLAARLAIFHLRKQAFGRFTPPNLFTHVNQMVAQGVYTLELLDWYTEEEWGLMDHYLVHERDLEFSYVSVKQLMGKYLLRHRVSGQYYESPQFLYILIAAVLFANYPAHIRLERIKAFYHAISLGKISLPTPIMAGVRTPTKQFSSCVLIECDDSLASINATANTIVQYVSQRAGIGINAGSIRALGSPIRGGEAVHTGCIPFYKYFQSAVKSCSQGGVRGGAATLFYPLWHLEIENLLVLKNNRGVEENRVRHLDYGVQINRFLYQRLLENGEITLFSPHDVPDLYQAFFNDQATFETLYQHYEQQPFLTKRKVDALTLFSQLLQERASTGRIYIQNIDHCNTHSAFNATLAPIRQSNLCMEITLPTQPLNSDPKVGEVALCTLAAINLGKIETLSDLQPLAILIVEALDALLDYQDYLLTAAERSALQRRPLGIGVINFAYYLAKNKVKYSDGSANALTHQTFEALQYYLLTASNTLAQQKGACALFKDTTYAEGLLPIDHYKKTVDEFCQQPLLLDWEHLRKQIQKYGLRHSTLTALMPSETSSQITNATNGIEPPRAPVSIKASKDGILPQAVPEISTLKDHYEYLWDIKDNTGYLQLVAIMQKFVDQAISANTHYDPEQFPEQKVPLATLLEDLITAYRYGIKTLYYHHTRDHGEEGYLQRRLQPKYSPTSDEACESGACHI